MRKTILILASLFACLVMTAGEVTEQEALETAKQVLRGRTFQQRTQHRAQQQGKEQFYVFNADRQDGFVIVSADDRTVPVLGYSETGSLNYAALPSHIKAWLDSYADQIKAIEGGMAPAPTTALGDPVAPLLTCHWDQDLPYNLQCPKKGDELCMTGCVATAMAQVMYYHRLPVLPVGALDGYSSGGVKVSSLPGTTFKWDLMRDDYLTTDTDEGADAVAELMRYCGQAVNMTYSPDGSGAVVYATTLSGYFGFSKAARNVSRTSFTTAAWEQMIYEELKAKRPVLYEGYNDTGGHEFVIDGYDGNGLFHVNWGWSGSSDGYFVLSVVNPDARGIGGGTSSNGYTLSQGATIGIQPDGGEAAAAPNIFFTSSYNSSSYTRTSSAKDFTFDAKGYVSFFGEDPFVIDHAWALCKLGVVKKILASKMDMSVSPNQWNSVSQEVAFGAGLADGIYELRQMYRAAGMEEWGFCAFYDNNILLAEINGNKLTLKYSSEIPDVVKVNGVTIDGIMKQTRPMTATINWTNQGYLPSQRFYIWAGKNLVGTAESYMAPGETGDVDINFEVSTSGTVTIKVTTDEEGTDVVYSQEVTISKATSQRLSSTISVTNATAGKVEGTVIKADVTLDNIGTNTYDDYITLSAWYDGGDGYLYYQTESPFRVQLAADETTVLKNCEITGLQVGKTYYLSVDYFSVGGVEESNMDNDHSYTMVQPTGIGEVTVSPQRPKTGLYDLRGRQLSTPRKGIIIQNGKKYVVK